MRARRVLVVLVAAGLTAGLGVAVAAPASATDVGTFNGCAGGDVLWGTGDTFTVVFDDAVCSFFGANPDGAASAESIVDGDTCWTFTNPGGARPQTLASELVRTTAVLTGSTTALPAQCGDSVTPAGPAAVRALAATWVQAYGRFGKDATCADGWAPSWQPWAVKVTGGWVCTRSIPSLG